MARLQLQTSFCFFLFVTIAMFHASNGARFLDGSLTPGTKVVEVDLTLPEMSIQSIQSGDVSNSGVSSNVDTRIDSSTEKSEVTVPYAGRRNGKLLLREDDYAALLFNFLPKGGRRNSAPSRKHN